MNFSEKATTVRASHQGNIKRSRTFPWSIQWESELIVNRTTTTTTTTLSVTISSEDFSSQNSEYLINESLSRVSEMMVMTSSQATITSSDTIPGPGCPLSLERSTRYSDPPCYFEDGVLECPPTPTPTFIPAAMQAKVDGTPITLLFEELSIAKFGAEWTYRVGYGSLGPSSLPPTGYYIDLEICQDYLVDPTQKVILFLI